MVIQQSLDQWFNSQLLGQHTKPPVRPSECAKRLQGAEVKQMQDCMDSGPTGC